MEIKKILERLFDITDKLNSMEGEFEELKKQYNHLDIKIRDLCVERRKLVDELMVLCYK